MKNILDWITDRLKDIFWRPNYTFPYTDGKSSSLMAWFRVAFDETAITLDVTPREREAWTARIDWARIIRVCFKTGDYFYTCDEIYIFTDERPESYLIPMEAVGAEGLWNEIMRRELFSAALAIEAASTMGKLFCQPAADETV